jgi:hypothetical protein
MDNFTNAVKEALTTKNWYAALVVSLTLPDICGRLECPNKGSGARYSDWFKIWVEPAYTAQIGAERTVHTFLSGGDCYALRCSLLHQGESEISQQRAQEMVERFHFIAPREGMIVHCDSQGTRLILQVDQFCNDICDGVQMWLGSVANNDAIKERMSQMISIEIPPEDGPISIRI